MPPSRPSSRHIIKDHGAVVFNDDGYADDWQIEAAERGLPNLKTTLDALPELITDESMELFSHYGVFNHREMHSRYEIALEQYILSIHVEAALTLEMATTVILPAAMRYQTELALNVSSLAAIGHERRLGNAGRGVGRAQGLADRHRRRCDPQSTTGMPTPRRSEPEHAQEALLPAMAAIRGLPPMTSRPWWPTTCGRSPPTRRCSSSCSSPVGQGSCIEPHPAPHCSTTVSQKRRLDTVVPKCSLQEISRSS